MRALFLATMALAALAGLSTTPAEARDYPFCIKGRDYAASVGDCRFPSYAACQASAAGTFSYCDRNPFYAWGQYDGSQRPSRRSRGQAY